MSLTLAMALKTGRKGVTRLNRPSLALAITSVVVSIALAMTTDVTLSATWMIPLFIGASIVAISAPGELVGAWALLFGFAIAGSAGALTAPSSVQSIGRYFTLALFLLALIRSAPRRDTGSPTHKLRATPIMLAAMWIILAAGSTALFAADIGLVLSVLAAWASPFLAVIIARRFSSEAFGFFLRGLIGVGLAQAFLAYADLMVSIPVWGYRVLVNGERSVNSILGDGFFRSQGAAGHAILLGFILGIAFMAIWVPQSRIRPPLAVFLSVVLAGALLLSGTRSTLLAIILAVGYLLVIGANGFGRRVRNAAIIAFALAFIFTNSSVNRYLGSLGEAFADSGSYSHRQGAVDSIPALLTDLPIGNILFGNGSEGASKLYVAGYLQQDGFRVVDNQAVTTFIEMGLFGVCVLAAIILLMLLRGNVAVRALIIMTTIVLFSFDFFLWPAPTLLLFTLLGASYSLAMQRENVNSMSPPPNLKAGQGHLRRPSMD